MPFERCLRLSVKIVERACVPQATFDPKTGAVVINGDRVVRVALDFDRIGAGGRCRLEKLQRTVEAAVVIAGQLADNVGLVARANGAAGDGYLAAPA